MCVSVGFGAHICVHVRVGYGHLCAGATEADHLLTLAWQMVVHMCCSVCTLEERVYSGRALSAHNLSLSSFYPHSTLSLSAPHASLKTKQHDYCLPTFHFH